MKLDNPRKPEFASWDSYSKFARRVRHERRYVLSKADVAFLATVRATILNRDFTLSEGKILYRAALGIDYRTDEDEDGNVVGESPIGFGADRMKPLPNLAVEGRANAAGIPVLYLGNTKQTVISEVRPWIGSSVSVAQFEILRPLKAINLTLGHGKSSLMEVGLNDLFNGKKASAKEKEKGVWIDIDSAFSRPVTVSDNAADYVPTQILAELFRDVGYEAMIYKSQFGEKGYNIVVFDPADAEIINCAPYEVKFIDVKFEGSGNAWFKKKAEKKPAKINVR